MFVVWIIDSVNSKDVPVKILPSLQEAFEYKENLKIQYPGTLAYHTVGISVEPEELKEETEVINNVQG